MNGLHCQSGGLGFMARRTAITMLGPRSVPVCAGHSARPRRSLVSPPSVVSRDRGVCCPESRSHWGAAQGLEPRLSAFGAHTVSCDHSVPSLPGDFEQTPPPRGPLLPHMSEKNWLRPLPSLTMQGLDPGDGRGQVAPG
ncbi:hypothetical protein HJG60_010780 [Phyllostomus discolor]|uniref:Uncharacterized protein n=1 Tax=Phyllostomus discolor TaxID=89673 RepID=A0A834ECN9_9CHIR|nr:hypothetical protein HJG60_010780 [Phyllostomus discolor]